MTKYLVLLLTAITINLHSDFSFYDEEEPSEYEMAIAEELATYDWKEKGEYQLDQSNSSIVVPEGYSALIGEDARKNQQLFQFEYDASVEAVVFNQDSDDVIIFSYSDDGYVSVDDWEEVNASDLLQAIAENTETVNIEREKHGAPLLHVKGWVQEPVLDKQNNTVFWAIEGYSDDDVVPVINSYALRLGRRGYESINWITPSYGYSRSGGDLQVMLDSYRYNPGYRYSDYIHGDKIASYGIASLVAASVGGKIAKSTGLLFGLKKIGAFIFAGIAALFVKLKKWFKGTSADKG